MLMHNSIHYRDKVYGFNYYNNLALVIIYHIANNNIRFMIDSIPFNSESCYVVQVTITKTTTNGKCVYLQDVLYVYLFV